jgi:ferredoxin
MKFCNIFIYFSYLLNSDKISRDTLSYNLWEVKLMAYKITDACVSCGACAAECPVNAISEGDSTYVIDADVCIDCGSCANVCPVGAPEEA